MYKIPYVPLEGITLEEHLTGAAGDGVKVKAKRPLTANSAHLDVA